MFNATGKIHKVLVYRTHKTSIQWHTQISIEAPSHGPTSLTRKQHRRNRISVNL
jgi:hypothetical protein